MKPSITPSMFNDKFIDQIISDISPVLNQLPAGMTVIVENLFPYVVWSETSPYIHSLFGMQIAYLVNEGRVKLKPHPTSTSVTRRYIVT